MTTISNIDESGGGHCQQTYWNRRAGDHWRKWHCGNSFPSFNWAEIFHLFTLNENKFFETNHSNFEFKSKMPRAMTICPGLPQGNLLGKVIYLQSKLHQFIFLTNFRLVPAGTKLRLNVFFLIIGNVYESLHLCSFPVFFWWSWYFYGV